MASVTSSAQILRPPVESLCFLTDSRIKHQQSQVCTGMGVLDGAHGRSWRVQMSKFDPPPCCDTAAAHGTAPGHSQYLGMVQFSIAVGHGAKFESGVH